MHQQPACTGSWMLLRTHHLEKSNHHLHPRVIGLTGAPCGVLATICMLGSFGTGSGTGFAIGSGTGSGTEPDPKRLISQEPRFINFVSTVARRAITIDELPQIVPDELR